jgi:hypothetical protein
MASPDPTKGEPNKVQTMKNTTQNFPVCSPLMNSTDRFYPARSSFVTNGDGQIDAAAPRMTARPAAQTVTVSDPCSWWARSYNQGLPAVGGRYEFLRGAWLPQGPCAGWNASASWGACAPSAGEAC